LHGSYLADGFPKGDSSGDADDETDDDKANRGAGVHSTYETNMIDRFAPQLVAGIEKKLKQLKDLAEVRSGFEAAQATVELMDRSAKRIPPEDLVNAFIQAGGTKHAAERDALFQQFGTDTAAVMADGARVLAMIWKSAWTAGGGAAIAAGEIKGRTHKNIKALYQDPEFVPSLTLDDIGPVLK
jgi:hypothetical protein